MEFMQSFVIIFKIVSTLVELYITCTLYSYGTRLQKPIIRQVFLLLCAIFACATYADIGWILSVIHKAHLLPAYSAVTLFVVSYKRIGWMLNCIEYFMLSVFLERLIHDISYRKIFVLATAIPCAFIVTMLLYAHITHFFIVDAAQRNFEFMVYGWVHYYIVGLLCLMISRALWNAYNINVPRIVRQQLTTFAYYFLVPHLTFIMISTNIYIITMQRSFPISSYPFIMLSDVIYIGSLYLCIRRLLDLRFLGINNHIQRSKKTHFVELHQERLAELNTVDSLEELSHITKELFAAAFHISPDHITLYIRPRAIITLDEPLPPVYPTVPAIEGFFATDANKELIAKIAQLRILIKDELAFDVFYESEPLYQELLAFLCANKAEIFMPIYEGGMRIVGYMIITEEARPGILFSSTERAEMLSYTNYLRGVMYFLQHRNLKDLMVQEKQMREELFRQQRELQHCNESLRTLALHEQQQIGIALYAAATRKISWASTLFQKLLELEGNDHPRYSPTIRQLCEDVMRYGAERSTMLIGEGGNKFHCIAVPCSKLRAQVLLIVHRSHAAESTSIPLDQYRDIELWRYLLYLETTESGRFICQAIPGSSMTMTLFKIELLKASLSKRALLIEAAPEDRAALLNILHYVGLRDAIHKLILSEPEKGQEIALKLFGMASTVVEKQAEKPLLMALHNQGTLYIEHIDYLSTASQVRIAEFLEMGMFRQLMSDRYVYSNLRIVCATSSPLEQLVQEGKLLPALAALLERTRLTMPSITSLPHHELSHLAHQISEQAISNLELRATMSLTPHDILSIIHRDPRSFQELADHVHTILDTKAHKKQLAHRVTINRAPQGSPPDIVAAIELGKDALKSREVMERLWNYFQSQVKIADFLNVNRSTVNRRLKQFNIGVNPEKQARMAAAAAERAKRQRMRTVGSSKRSG